MKHNIGLNCFLQPGYINKKMFDSMNKDAEEMVKLLVASIKTIKSKLIIKNGLQDS